jgi:hypothetical protein
VQVRYDEGVAIHIDHEPCAVACEGDSEASAEEHQPLSPAKIHIPGADAVAKAEGDTAWPLAARAQQLGRMQRREGADLSVRVQNKNRRKIVMITAASII